MNPALAWTVVHTLVFGGLFAARWPEAASAGLGAYGMALFYGLTAFNLFAECVTRAPTLVVAAPNLVRKVVFPFEVLPLSAVASAPAHALVSLSVLLAVRLLTEGRLPPTVLPWPKPSPTRRSHRQAGPEAAPAPDTARGRSSWPAPSPWTSSPVPPATGARMPFRLFRSTR